MSKTTTKEEKVLVFGLPIFIGLMAFAISHAYFVDKNHHFDLSEVAISLAIGGFAGFICWFCITMIPEFLLIVAKKAKNTFKLFLLSTAHEKQNEETSDREDNEYTDSPVVVSEKNEPVEEDKWEKAKEILRKYIQTEIFQYFPQKYHLALLQLIEDFASNNVDCSSPITCTLEEIPELQKIDLYHFIGNFWLIFKQVDKRKVMNRQYDVCQFAKNAFPNIIAKQSLETIYRHLVQHTEYNIIRNFKEEAL